jgi:hypothetical protein
LTHSPYVAYTAKMNAAIASQEYEVRPAAGARPQAVPSAAVRRKLKSYEKIYESVQPAAKAGARHLSRRRGIQYGAVERFRLEGTLGLQS